MSCLFFGQERAGVINVGALSKLRRMVRTDGLSVREASKKLGIARNTAARWLSMRVKRRSRPRCRR